MSNSYYLGNGNKRPRLADYKREFGWNGHTFYTLDLLKYEQKREAYKTYKENQKKASEYAKKRWG